jgi:hypothetical protein
MESIFKMAILCFPVSPSEPCIFVIFKLKNSKFRILIEKYITTNDTFGFFDKLSISSGIVLKLGPSRNSHRANRQLIKEPRRAICCDIVFYQNPKFEVYRFENGENTRLKRTDRKNQFRKP